VLIGLGLILLALICVLIAALFGISPLIAIIGWAFGGGGMGLLYPRLTVLTLAYSDDANQGFNSSALSIAENTGSALVIAIAGLAVASLGGGAGAFGAVYALCIGLALLALVPGLRLGHAAEMR